MSSTVGRQEGKRSLSGLQEPFLICSLCWVRIERWGQGARSGSAKSLGVSSPGPNQQSTWAALGLSLQRWEDSATCSGALLTGDMQEPDRDRTGQHLLFS